MRDKRLKKHPVLEVPEKKEVTVYWQNQPIKALEGEMIASALIANDIHIFGHHHKDKSAQGIFCANGQCSKCMVIANGLPVKSCMTPVKENMIVESVEGLPELPEVSENPMIKDIEEVQIDVLIIGGGPAGLSAAIQIGKNNIKTIIIDDKDHLGGKLVLQTHKFFGSVEDSYAGTRGNDIGKKLAEAVLSDKNIEVWLNSTALFAFKDKKIGILKNGKYKIVVPRVVLNAAGAREKFLRFKGNTLAGIYGAGAFQTLVNRDLIRSSDRLFIIGGGNVGLIAGYHALQAGIDVVGLVEALPQCGGYKVHADKLKRLGVPIYTSHSILSANGDESVESITICEIDSSFKPIAGTEKSFKCDTILIAVGLEPVDEFTEEAKKAGIDIFSAGDAQEIAEASSAMFNGKIAGLKIAKYVGADVQDVPESWYEKAEILKKHPGVVNKPVRSEVEEGVLPVIHCVQEIPCNPCSTICPTNSIFLKEDPIMGIPEFSGNCIGCGKCVAICPGLAITLVDYRKDKENPVVTLPYEVTNIEVKTGDYIQTVDIDGNVIEQCEVISIQKMPQNKTNLIKIKASKENAKNIVSFKIQNTQISAPMEKIIYTKKMSDEAMVCLCERVTAGEVRSLIEQGIYDLNQIKAITRAGMGPCGGKSCDNLVRQVFREEGVEPTDIVANTIRPVFVEVPLGVFSGKGGSNE